MVNKETLKIALQIGLISLLPLGAVATIITATTISIQEQNKVLAWCKEEFEFDYHEIAYAHEISTIKNTLKEKLYKVVLYGETTSATYLYNVAKNVGYNYTNQSN
jgi:hypothetical protein